jgi:hypothetical protein
MFMLMSNIRYNIRMPAPADGKPLLSESALCRLAGVDRNRRRAWAKQGHLRQRGHDGYGELDAAELAIFHRLATLWDFDRAREAWRGAQPGLTDALWARPLWIVLNEGRAEGALVHDEKTLFEFAGREGRFQIVEVGGAVTEALEGFRNAVAARNRAQSSEKQANVQILRKESAK